ncbi:Glycine receptor subunit alpha-3 [Mactra antiquata]
MIFRYQCSINMVYFPVLRYLVISIQVCLCLAGGNMTRQDVLNVLLGLTDDPKYKYDSSIAPDFEMNFPTEVYIQVLVQNIYSVSESSMDYSLDIFFLQKWTDIRLKYENMTDLEWLEMDNKMMSNVWVPDTYFSNEKKANVHDVMVPNKMMHLYSNGTVLYSSRLSLTLSCNMRLQKYPLDDQLCPIIIESYAYTVDNVIYHWEEVNRLKILSDAEMPQFQAKVDNTLSDKCSKPHTETFIRLRRKVGYYIVQVFVPSILIVVLSWVSFWVDHDAVAARISLGVLTVLTMTTQSSGAKQSLPQVSYVKAIDVWMFTCLLFVFAALVEYSYVNIVARKRTKALLASRQLELLPENGLGDTFKKAKLVSHHTHLAARRVDKVSRFVFPLLFLIFNLAFWTYYHLIPSPD